MYDVHVCLGIHGRLPGTLWHTDSGVRAAILCTSEMHRTKKRNFRVSQCTEYEARCPKCGNLFILGMIMHGRTVDRTYTFNTREV